MSNINALSYTTTRIKVIDRQGQCNCGTGFFFAFRCAEDQAIPLLVTNRHMIEGSDTLFLRFAVKDDTGEPVMGKFKDCRFDDFCGRSIFHPNLDVDLAIMPLGDFMRDNEDVYALYFSETDIPDADDLKEISPTDEIVMVGYPLGIADEKNNLPVFRRGILATSAVVDYDGEKIFLIDASCFPGSSGSPVLLSDKTTRHKERKLFFGKQNFLLGIQSAVFMHDISGEITAMEIPTRLVPRIQTKIPTNLGIVVKSSCILDFKQFFPDVD